jgi:hypothetical protein
VVQLLLLYLKGLVIQGGEEGAFVMDRGDVGGGSLSARGPATGEEGRDGDGRGEEWSRAARVGDKLQMRKNRVSAAILEHRE